MYTSHMDNTTFSQLLIEWQKQHGRHHLPWQQNRTPYSVWLSEVMLQQTQVSKVIEYFNKFITLWPTVHDLASASEDQVLQQWSGMGYYRRARNLYKAACIMSHFLKENNEIWPENTIWWESLPGVGKTTANAICAQSFGMLTPILDANARRVYQSLNNDGTLSDVELWKKAYVLIEDVPNNKSSVIAYTQGLMDLGSSLCTPMNKSCNQCPVKQVCAYDAETYTTPLKVTKQKKEEYIHWGIYRKEGKVAISNNGTFFSIWDKMYILPSIVPSDKNTPLLTFTHILTHKKLTISIYDMSGDIDAKNGDIVYISPSDLHHYARPKPMDIIFTNDAFLALCQGE